MCNFVRTFDLHKRQVKDANTKYRHRHTRTHTLSHSWFLNARTECSRVSTHVYTTRNVEGRNNLTNVCSNVPQKSDSITYASGWMNLASLKLKKRCLHCAVDSLQFTRSPARKRCLPSVRTHPACCCACWCNGTSCQPEMVWYGKERKGKGMKWNE